MCRPRSSWASRCSITAAAAFVYAGSTRLNAPRYATVVALQPVPPLLAYPMIESPAGWGMALATVALLDLLLLTTVIRRGRLVPRWPLGRPVAGDREGMAEVDARDIGATDYANRDAVPTRPTRRRTRRMRRSGPSRCRRNPTSSSARWPARAGGAGCRPGSSPGRRPERRTGRRFRTAGAARHPAVRQLAARAHVRPALRRRRGRPAVRRWRADRRRRGGRRGALRA